MARTINNNPESFRLKSAGSIHDRTTSNRFGNENVASKTADDLLNNLNPQLERKVNDPDFQLDLTYSGNAENAELDGNLNKLMALVRLAIGKIQQTKKEHKKLNLTKEENDVREKIANSKTETLHQARILFAQGILTIAFSNTPILTELAHNKDLFKGISDTAQVISTTFTKGSEANNNELNNYISLAHQQIQKLNNEERSPLQSAEDLLARMSSEMRVN